ncbi:helix-turn-helix transcriptional regulator [Paenibacillus profundus]|uniref:Helix-turn-helix transcriptional regulator n=1 Tax=Paenibacillus profundus TaxID=1173085 RepID=A0ABS8YND6_9BACL|nr:helix-turn-helix transcriptional regulator [Paenibacillus profundus]MCE5173330.1 helix-turn-helix transcriptional regulator [Paenibacillus profundus]
MLAPWRRWNAILCTADEIAEWVGYSPYHFHRIFQSVTRNSVSEYIRGRRLTLAAYDLFYSNLRIVEIAIKYHFTSQEAFTRAFQQKSESYGTFSDNAYQKLIEGEIPSLFITL